MIISPVIGISKCNEECVTVARSCEILLEEDTERDDFYAVFFKNQLTKEETVVSMGTSANYSYKYY